MADKIFAKSFTLAYFLTSWNLPEEKRVNRKFLVPKCDNFCVFNPNIWIISQFWTLQVNVIHYIILRGQLLPQKLNNTFKNCLKSTLTLCWWFYTSAACDACDKYHVCWMEVQLNSNVSEYYQCFAFMICMFSNAICFNIYIFVVHNSN